jgi:hypothetical protein
LLDGGVGDRGATWTGGGGDDGAAVVAGVKSCVERKAWTTRSATSEVTEATLVCVLASESGPDGSSRASVGSGESGGDGVAASGRAAATVTRRTLAEDGRVGNTVTGTANAGDDARLEVVDEAAPSLNGSSCSVENEDEVVSLS